MPFNSFLFLLGFLPCALIGHAGACRLGPNFAKAWLIAASLLFYGASAPRFIPLLLVSVSGNLLVLLALRHAAHRNCVVLLGVAFNLSVLGWFKYIAPSIWPDALLPLGVSFFTFTQIGCLLAQAAPDARAVKVPDYLLFVLFFPALIAGPILHPEETLPQFERTGGWRLTIDDMLTGSGFFVVGLLKKTLLADPLSGLVGAGFADPASLSLLPAWQAAMAWSLQLYFDFSGYSDMAIGLGWMFGFRLPDNFNQPYRARSMIAYWQSWHMSLTRFLMGNVHAPLTLMILRRRCASGIPINHAAQKTPGGFMSMIATPIVLAMVLAGIWHGPTLIFLLFGLFHAALLLINHAWRLWRAPQLPAVAGVVATYLCVLVGAVLFRATSIDAAGELLAGMAGLHGLGLPAPDEGSATAMPDAQSITTALWLAGLYAVVWLAPTTRQFMLGTAVSRISWHPSPGWAVAMGFAATLGLLASGGAGEFVYFHF